MPFLFADSFIENVTAFRVLYVGGRYGSGKTLLCVALARYLYERGFVQGVVANFPIDEDFIPPSPTIANSVVILDEASQFADARDSRKGFSGYGAAARKLNSIWLFPSVYPPDKRMRFITCVRDWDIFLLNWWLYNWYDVQGTKGRFVLSNPDWYFPYYSHRFYPEDDAGILAMAREEVKALAAKVRRIYVPGVGLRLVEVRGSEDIPNGSTATTAAIAEVSADTAA